MLVLWTAASVNSKNVRDEARLALSSEKLVNAIIAVPRPPFPFDRVNALPLDGWRRGEPHSGWTRLVETIEGHFVRLGAVQPGDLTTALERLESAVRDKQGALAAAEAALEDTKGREAQLGAALTEAADAADRAEQQVNAVTAIGASPTILSVARAELESAKSAFEEAKAEHRAASDARAGSARALAAAKRDLEALASADARPAAAAPRVRPSAPPAEPPEVVSATRADPEPLEPPPPPPPPPPPSPPLPPPPPAVLTAPPAPPVRTKPKAQAQAPAPRNIPAAGPISPESPLRKIRAPAWFFIVLFVLLIIVAMLSTCGRGSPPADVQPTAPQAAVPAPPAPASSDPAPTRTQPETAMAPDESVDPQKLAEINGYWSVNGVNCPQPVAVRANPTAIVLTFPSGRVSPFPVVKGLQDGAVETDGERVFFLADRNKLEVSDGKVVTTYLRCADPNAPG